MDQPKQIHVRLFGTHDPPWCDHAFGQPSRITATTAMGRAGIIDIDREAAMSGAIHTKGVLILSGFLRARFAQSKPLTLTASLCFEQNYGGIDGDSASSTEIYAILAWHFHKTARAYLDVVVQVADDADFTKNVRTIFNNDHDNSAGLGAGKDMNYVETSEGKLVDAKGVKAPFVRLYSSGSNANDLNHYVEVEVFGRPAK